MKSYILVTGASSGVGKELAIQLSGKWSLILNGRDEKRLIETKEQCDNVEDILIWRYDLSDIDNLERELKSWIKEHDVAIEGFIHCAGVMQMLPCKAYSLDAFMNTYKVNVFAAAMITKVLSSKRINERNLKSVVFISSNVSNRGVKAFGIYGSSKAALDGLMRNLAIELAPNVRVNSILPGGMITEMTRDMFEDEQLLKQFQKNYPLGIGTPKNIEPMVEFLLSDEAGWITGQQFVIDGGRSIDITEKSN